MEIKNTLINNKSKLYLLFITVVVSLLVIKFGGNYYFSTYVNNYIANSEIDRLVIYEDSMKANISKTITEQNVLIRLNKFLSDQDYSSPWRKYGYKSTTMASFSSDLVLYEVVLFTREDYGSIKIRHGGYTVETRLNEKETALFKEIID